MSEDKRTDEETYEANKRHFKAALEYILHTGRTPMTGNNGFSYRG